MTNTNNGYAYYNETSNGIGHGTGINITTSASGSGGLYIYCKPPKKDPWDDRVARMKEVTALTRLQRIKNFFKNLI